MGGASPCSAGASMRSAGVFMPLRARCAHTESGRQKTSSAHQRSQFFFHTSLSLFKDLQRCAWCCRVCMPRLLAKAQVLCWSAGGMAQKRTARADRSGHSSRLSETSLSQKMRFGHVHPHLVPIQLPLAAWTASAAQPHLTCSFCIPPPAGGSPSPQGRRAYPRRKQTSAPGETKVRPQRRRRDVKKGHK